MDFRRRKPLGRGAEDYVSERDAMLENQPWSPFWEDEWDDALPRHAGGGQGGDVPPPDRGRWRRRWKWIRRGFAALLLIFFLLVAWLAITAPLNKSLQPIAAPQITLLASDGTPIARKGAMVEDPVEAEKLPDHVIQPFLAIEDRRFYSHWGVDPRGVARAVFTGHGGGSTITQQLAKFTFLTPEQTLTRKAREALIAFWLEAWLTKDEILERYLSNAYFGDNMYGLRAASLHYFYRQPENLRPEQAAMLAGLLQAPSRLAPTRNPDLAAKRYELVKGALVAAGYRTQAEVDAMRVPALDVRTRNNLPTGTYFADWALPQVRRTSEDSYSRETIQTTLDSRLQGIARRVTERAPLGGAQVALVAMRPNGEVVAMIGGKDYAKSPFNRATQAKRQVGSTFKLFVYLAALREGLDGEDIVQNTEFSEGSYRPRNSDGRYSASISLKDGFARSSNVAAVRLQQRIGSQAVIDTARDLGITAELPDGDPSMALGTGTMDLLQLTAAYAGIAGNSFPVTPHAFPKEEEGWFDWLTSDRSSLSSRTHMEMQDLLRLAVDQGTGRAARLSVPAYGKTGTTQDNRDALFVGFAGDLVVGVWIGNDDNSPLKGVSGGGLPARIWRDFMASALRADVAPPRATPSPDPSGPVQPLDVPDLQDIPLGDDRTTLSIRNGRAVITTEIDGVPVDVELGGEDGVRFSNEERLQEEIDRMAEARERARERMLEERLRFEEQMRGAVEQVD